MKKIKSKYFKALALLLSMAMLMTGLPTPIYAESFAMPTDMTEVPETVETPEKPVQEDVLADESVPAEETVDDLSEDSEELPAESLPEDESLIEDELTEEVIIEENPVKAAIDANGYAYLMTDHRIQAFRAADMWEPCFNIEPDGILLVTAFIEQDDLNILEVQFLTSSGELMLAYVFEDDLSDVLLMDTDIDAAALATSFSLIFVEDGKVAVFAVEGMVPREPNDDQPVVGIPNEPEQPNVPSEEHPVEIEETPIEQPESDLPLEGIPSVEDFILVSAGAFVLVTTDTRAFLEVDDSAAEDYEGDLNLGRFVHDAAVQVESIEQDSMGRYWYLVRYMYGDTYADGTLKWTEYGSIYVLAVETYETDAQAFDVTDYAFSYVPRSIRPFSTRSASSMDGFRLRDISMSLGNFYLGQSGLYGDSGKDSEYLQIATLAGHGKIYATPHYLEGYTVYCLEHLLPGPGERISGGGYQPRGPYVIVDIDSYMNTPGYSSIMYEESTMHAIAWVLRHTVPFMELDRYDADNRTWSRVAGQFAIREVIKQLEGSQYVRDHWEMDDFYAASDNAPSVYLEYARWLAANGIARAAMTGDIYVSNQNVTTSGGLTVGTVTLTTDADLIRISKNYGTVSGHTRGEDSAYYYLSSGDTITITSSASAFSFTAESMSSPDEEAGFVVGVPNEPIQKLLIPTEGLPYPLKSVTVSFDAPYGSVSVTKTDAETGEVLAGATFDLISGSTVIQSMTTGTDGVVTFTNVPPGTYTIREQTAPEGYVLGPVNVQTVDVSNGQTSRLSFADKKISARIKIIKTDQWTAEPLAGVEFTITRLSAPATDNGAGVGDSFTITTDANGIAETDWLEWGCYLVEETGIPENYVDSQFSTNINAYENDQTYVIEVQNEPVQSYVTLSKTDITGEKMLSGAVIEVYDENGKMVYRDTTDKNGEITNIIVSPGRYTFREVYAPDGYALNDVTMSFTVSEDGVVTGDTTIRDDYTRFSIVKLDDSNTPLAGVEFSLVASNDAIISTARTNRKGIATFEKVSFGTYRIVEAQPLAGYSTTETEVEVTVDGTFINPEHPLATIINHPNEIVIRKVDQEDKPLAGATFGLFDTFGERFAVATSDENGMARFTKVPYGNYTIRELAAPDGYLASREEIAVTIDADYRSSDKPIATVKNHFKRVQFIKVDTSGKYLPGVEFSLINAVTHEVVETAVSNDKGEFIFTKFDYGDWIVRETAAPEGYNRMEDYLLHVDENWRSPNPITLVNIPSTYMFFKSDNKKNALAGATFVVEDAKGHVVQEVVSAENGVVYIYGLTPGKYTIREISTVEGFTVSDDIIEVVIDEKYEVPVKLKRFVNYPSISTGVDVSPTMLTWIGLGLAGSAGITVLVGLKRRNGGKKRKD